MWWACAASTLCVHFIHYVKTAQELQLLSPRQLIASHKSNPSSVLLGYIDSNFTLGGGNSCGVYTLYRVTTTHAG
jgi:hypothetical protein